MIKKFSGYLSDLGITKDFRAMFLQDCIPVKNNCTVFLNY